MKKQGWEKSLDDYIQGQRHTKFEWGKNDCVLFAARAALAQGVDTVQEIENYGEYDKAKAIEILRNHGGDLSALFDKRFKRRYPKSRAMRGDIALVIVDGVKAAGVIDGTGRHVAIKTYDGVRHVPLADALIVWGVE